MSFSDVKKEPSGGVTRFLGFDHFYLLEDPVSNSYFRGDFDSTLDPLRITRGEDTTTMPIPVRWDMGQSTPSDIIWTTSAHPIIVQQRVVDLLKHHNLTGWRTYPVSVFDKSDQLHGNYAGLQIIGRCGPEILSRATVELKRYPGGWFPHFVGHYFDEATWDGSDLFMHTTDAKGRVSGHIVVSERVHEGFTRAGIRNVTFTRLTEVSVSASIYKTSRPDLLPDDFEERVTRAYAERDIPRP
jgi:hypothetical protein